MCFPPSGLGRSKEARNESEGRSNKSNWRRQYFSFLKLFAMTEIPMSRNNPTNKEDTEASIDVQRDGETIVVVCHDRRLDTDEMIVDWSKKIEKLIRENPGKTVLVDFTDVFLMTSYGLQRAIALLFITQELKSPFGFFGMNSYLFDV